MEERSKGRGRTIMIILILLLLLGSCVLCSLCTFSLFTSGYDPSANDTSSESGLELLYVAGDADSDNKFLMVPITGVILNERPDDILSLLSTDVTYGYEIKDILEGAALDSSIKGVILAIDSPGGTVTGSKAISDAVDNYRSLTSKPIVAHIMGMGASGGYWAAASADHIIADNGSLIGSIGVIFGPFKYYDKVTAESSGSEGISTENGIETYYITSGEYKDFGNPYRLMSEEEMNIMQEDTDDVYNEFVQYISQRRNIPDSRIRSEVKALPYGNDRAIKLGLIDASGSRETAYDYLSEKALLGSDYQVVKVYEEVDFWDLFFSAFTDTDNRSVSNEYLSKALSNKILFLYGTPLDY